MDDSLNERVARFIARYRTVIAKSSVEKIEGFIDYLERRGGLFWADEIEELKEIRLHSEVVKDAENEEERYQELLAQDVVRQLLAIQGVKSVEVVTSDQGIESLEVTIQAYYLFGGIFYDAGEWVWRVPMQDEGKNMIRVSLVAPSYRLFVSESGICFRSYGPLFYGLLIRPVKGSEDEHPLYPGPELGFCFGDLQQDILENLLAGNFVSAFQLISLCLNHYNAEQRSCVPTYFYIAYDVDVRELAEYFDLNEEAVKLIEARYQALRKGDDKNV